MGNIKPLLGFWVLFWYLITHLACSSADNPVKPAGPTNPQTIPEEEGTKPEVGDFLSLLEQSDESTINKALDELIKKGFKLDEPLEGFGIPPLHCMVAQYQKKAQMPKCKYNPLVLKALVNKGVNLDLKSSDQNGIIVNDAPLNIAVGRGDKKIVEDLVNAKANPNILGSSGAPLHEAIKNHFYQDYKRGDYMDIIRMLLKSENINASLKDSDGKEPLFYARNNWLGGLTSDAFKAVQKPIVDLFNTFGIN